MIKVLWQFSRAVSMPDYTGNENRARGIKILNRGSTLLLVFSIEARFPLPKSTFDS